MKSIENVKLTKGLFYDSQKKGNDVILALDIDRLLAPYYEAANLPPKKRSYGGWEEREIRGHSLGHWLSAAAAMYETTGDKALLERIDRAVQELATIQDDVGYVGGVKRAHFDEMFSGEFQVGHFNIAGTWVPWYNLHKLFAGLIDVHQLTGHSLALTVVTKLADWAKKGTDQLTDDQFQRMLICEHGGMNEAMADLYTLTGHKDYLQLAIRFCHWAVLEPLANGIDELEGKHANTQIPKVIGAAKLFEITGDDTYRAIAEFFWRQVTNDRSYIIGGNSNSEHFGPANKETLGVETAETCNTYNMLKLTEHLFRWNRSSQLMDYYEKALYNHILASQDPDTGMKTYFVSLQPGHFKVYSSLEESFWCCFGTGLENPARYTRTIYDRDDRHIYVNLFMASEIHLKDLQVQIRQETNFPETDRTKLTFVKADGVPIKLHIRVPEWVAGPVTARINGKETFSESGADYLTIEREWQKGDEIEVHLPMELRIYEAKDDPHKVGIMYGPIVLAGTFGKDHFPETDIVPNHLSLHNHPLIDVPTLVATKKTPDQWIHPVEGRPLTFRTAAIGQPGNMQITLIPFYALHHERYTVYWNLMSEVEYEAFKARKEVESDRLQARTVDAVQPGEQQPEVEHQLKANHSETGYLNIMQKRWRDSRGEDGFFSYVMKVKPNQQMSLLVTYYGGDHGLFVDGKWCDRSFRILIDEEVIKEEQLLGKNPGETLDVYYPIPLALTEGKEEVVVTFASKEGTVAGGVYGVRMLCD